MLSSERVEEARASEKAYITHPWVPSVFPQYLCTLHAAGRIIVIGELCFTHLFDVPNHFGEGKE